MNGWKKWIRSLAFRTCAGLLALVLALGVPAAQAADSMQSYLDQVVDWGIMRGDIAGNLNENAAITRAEFVSMINRAFGYTKTGVTPFRDVPATAWYAEDVGIAYTMGYITGTSATTFSPESPVTRESAAVILARILALPAEVGENTLFSDSREMGNWSRGQIAAAARYGILNGYPDGRFGPKDNLTRGQAAILLVNSLGTPLQTSGEYSLGSTWGNVTIVASNTTLRDTVIGGNLYISAGVDLGHVLLENVTVLGEIVVCGGGASEGGDDSIILRNVDASKLVMDSITSQLISLRVEGDGLIQQAEVRTNAYISDKTDEDCGISLITLAGDGEEKLSLTVSGNIKNVTNTTPNSTLSLASGVAQVITVDELATGSTLHIAAGAQADTVNLDTGTTVTGSGDIGHLNVNAAGSTVSMLPDEITIRPGISANINGEVMDSQSAAEASADPRLSAGYPKISNLAPTSASAQFSANKKGMVYWAVTPVTDGSVSAEDLINPSSYSPKITKRGTVSLSGSGLVTTTSISGLTSGGSYYLSAVMVDARETRSPLKVISFSTPDDSKPDFANKYPYMSKITSTSGQVTVMTTKTCRLYYAILPAGASAPTADDFKSNAVTGNLGFGTMDVTKNTTYSFNVNSTPLEEQKSYDVYLWLTDVDGGQSSAVKKLTFTTIDGTPPVFNTEPTVNSVKDTSVGLYANLNEAGTLYWVVVPEGEVYPKPLAGQSGSVDLSSDTAKLQVMAGMNALKSGKVTMTENKDVSFNISGLEAEKSYDLYYVAQDKAGNYSATVKKITIHTADPNAPKVTQEFTKYNGTDTTVPLPDSDVRLIFSEAVQAVDGNTPLVDLYRQVTLTQGEAQKQAREQMAAILSNAIYLYQIPAGTQPVKIEGADDAAKESGDWTIDYRYAEITLDPDIGGTVITFPNGKGINLKSGATYYFEIQANTIADTSSAFNVMGRTQLDEFTTVFAQINLSALNENGISSYKTPDGSTVTPSTGTIPVDISWQLSPVSTEKVDNSIDWDMLIWSDTSVEFQLYRRELGSDDESWTLLGTQAITVPDGVTGYRGVSLTRNFLQSGSNNPDFDALNTLKEDVSYQYAISFTKVGGLSETLPRQGIWSQRINMKVHTVAGGNNNLGFLSSDITEENWEESLDSGVTNIGLPNDFSLRKQFTDNTAPSFTGGYPKFDAGDSAVSMSLMLDRPGTVYYVIAPMGYVDTKGGPNGSIDYGIEENWRTLPMPLLSGPGDPEQPTQPDPPDDLISPDYLNIVNASSNYRNEKIKYGSVSCGSSVEVKLVEDLDKLTNYTVYFVIQGTSQTYSEYVLAYRFQTTDVSKPVITLTNYSPSVNFQTDSTADLDYALVANDQVPAAWRANNSFDTLVNTTDSQVKAEWDKLVETDSDGKPVGAFAGENRTVLWALCTPYGTKGYSVFDQFAGSSIRKTVSEFISGANTMGATIAAQGSKSLTQANNYFQTQDFTNSMTGGTVYYCLATAVSPLGSETSFAGVSGVYIPDKTPPVLQSVSTTITSDLSNPLCSGSVTFVFNEPVYQLVVENGKDLPPKAVWQTKYSIDDDKNAVKLNEIVGSAYRSKFSCSNEVRRPSSTLTLKFTDIPLNTTLVLFDSSFICDASSNSTRQNLTFRLEETSGIGVIQQGAKIEFVQMK